jgi:hypothetical protein
VRARYWHAAYILVVAVVVSVATYQASRLARLSDISAAADKLIADREMHYTYRGYVLAVLSFLETHKDIYPDTYERAREACERFKCGDPSADEEAILSLSHAFDGIVRGIGSMSGN